jgi:quinol monooxygenase YgiN
MLLLSVVGSIPFLLSGCTTYTSSFRRPSPPTLPPDAEVVVALTQVDHRPGMRSAFFADTRRVLSHMEEHDGLIGYAFRFELFGRRAWTVSVWRDETALLRFIRSPAHRAAVRNSDATTEDMRFVRQAMRCDTAPPAWDEVTTLLSEAPSYLQPRTEAGPPGEP